MDTIKNNVLNVEWLKENTQRLYYFGLGFIQLKISDKYRVHFYTDEFEKTSDDEIHNHRYSFTSKVLKGTLEQEIYNVSVNQKGKWCIRKESCNKEVKSKAELISCDVGLSSKQTFGPGSEYWIDHRTFHKVSSNNAITLLSIDAYQKELADVVAPYDKKEFVCPFSIEVSQNRLFEIIDNRIKSD